MAIEVDFTHDFASTPWPQDLGLFCVFDFMIFEDEEEDKLVTGLTAHPQNPAGFVPGCCCHATSAVYLAALILGLLHATGCTRPQQLGRTNSRKLNMLALPRVKRPRSTKCGRRIVFWQFDSHSIALRRTFVSFNALQGIADISCTSCRKKVSRCKGHLLHLS